MKKIYIELVITSDIENILYTFLFKFPVFIPLYTTVHCFALVLKTGGKKQPLVAFSELKLWSLTIDPAGYL